MKRMIIASLTASLMFLFTAPVYADAVQHQWFCHRLDTATMDDVIAATAVWFKAAKKNEGAENMKLSLKFPVAADTIDGDFIQQVTFPSLAEWLSMRFSCSLSDFSFEMNTLSNAPKPVVTP